jgi:hypothetical protein
MRSKSKRMLPYSPLTSSISWFLCPSAKRIASNVPIVPFSNSIAAAKRIVHIHAANTLAIRRGAFSDKSAHGAHALDFAH